MHYVMHITSCPPGFIKARIDAIPAAIVGNMDSAGKLWKPCKDSIARAVPFRYRKAVQREAHIWRSDMPGSAGMESWSMNISDRRGRYLKTIHLIPSES